MRYFFCAVWRVLIYKYNNVNKHQDIVKIDFTDCPVAKAPAPNARVPGSIPGQGIRSHMLQLRPETAK